MTAFEIGFTADRWVDEGTSFRGVQLTLQDWTEKESAALNCWSTKDYESQWLAELNRIVTDRDKGALITSLNDPVMAFQVRTWTMWKDDNQILFQNRILFMLEGCHDFNPANGSDYIGEYQSHDEDGQRLSEWTVPITAIRKFISSPQFAN